MAVNNALRSIDQNYKQVSVGIITATYNAARDLPQLIQSLRGQTDQDFEWVVVDGASTDTTIDLLRESADVVRKFSSEPDFGIYDALNKALKSMSADYYLVLGSDDRLEPNAIEKYKEAAAKSGADIITGAVRANNKILKPNGKYPWLYGQRAYISGHSVGALIKRKLHERYGYYSCRFPLAADQFFIKKACKGGSKVFVADFVAGCYSDTGKSSADVLGAQTEFLRVQVETEKYAWLQILAFFARLVRHFR